MPKLKTAFRLALASLAFTLLGISAAWAPGTITLDEVMEQLKDDTKLIGEIDAQLQAQNLKPEAIICVGARFGGHWRELGGARAVPYACEVGSKKLNIEGTVHLYDETGNEIDMSDEKSPERAFDYKQTDLTWTWE